MLKLNQIYLKDCTDGLKELPDNSIDIILVDPPYNIGKDFGINKDHLPIKDYLNWAEIWLNQCFRILKPQGTMYIYGFSEILAHISTKIDIDKQRWLIWHYTNKNIPSFNFWQRSHESIICCWKDKPIFNRDDVREPYTDSFLKNSAGKTRAATSGRFQKKAIATVYNAHPNGALPRDVFNISTLAGGASYNERAMYCKTCQTLISSKEKSIHLKHELIVHPTQKPLALTTKLIKAARPHETDFTVVVPFAGSGSECLASIKNGGTYIGFEINPDYKLLAETYIASKA